MISDSTTDVDFNIICPRCGKNLLQCRCYQTTDINYTPQISITLITNQRGIVF